MIQKRHNIFETNSSTTHSLTVTRHRVTPGVIEEFKKEHGNHIIFGKNTYEYIKEHYIYNDTIINENTPFQAKADILYFSMYVWTDTSDGFTVAEFLLNRKLLTEKLQELGFTVEFREEQELLENAYYAYDVRENLFSFMWHDIDEVIDYLFDTHVLYYVYADDCCQYPPKEIEDADERFWKYKESEEQSHYNYR